MKVQVTVDVADEAWKGPVGVVSNLLRSASFEPANTAAFVCGPEVMMRFTALALTDLGVSTDRTYVSLERNMHCAVGLCGHCQFATELICRDGPVFAYDQVAHLLRVREL